MRFVFLIPLLGVVVFCAPVQDDQERKLVKRDDEEILFGNQQNPPKGGDNIAPGSEDSKGKVVATAAKPTEPEADNKESKDDAKEDSEEEKPEETEAESTETEEPAETEAPVAVSDESDNESADENDAPAITPENEGAIEELESLAGNSDSETQDSDVADDVNMIPESAMANYNRDQAPDDDAYRQYRMYQFLMNEYPSMLDRFSGDNLFGARRRRAAGKLLARLKARDVKRSHRSKRDLPYDIDLLSQLYSPELENDETLSPYSEEEVELENEPYVPIADDELEVEPYDEIQEIIYGGEPGYFIPSKSREMLNYVPTSKRESYFYPESKEPFTHYSAFLADKRDYIDTYGNLVRLARALAMQPEGREALLRGYEWE